MADYNINAITRRVVFTGSAGLGPYAFTFEVLDENDVAVYFNTTLLTLTTDYTVTINANGTGSVTIVTGSSVPSTPTASDSIIIVGARDIERVTDFVTAGDLLASSLNEQLDALTIFDQQLAEENARTLRAPVYDPALVADGGTLDMTLPAKAARAGKYLQFNSTTGNPEAGPDSTDVTALADIATDIATLADIEDGTDATDAIQTVAGISANVTTVAGIASNVSTVAGIQADVTAVAGDATDIGTVATNIASVNTVAGNISEVVAVANDLNEAVSEVETVANDLNEAVSEIETVAASIANVDTVGTNIANVNTVAGNNANVTTVAGISANVTTVAGISGNVTTVAGISGDVTTVAADGTDIGTVAGAISNVNTVAGISGNVTTVAGISGNVTTVAGISSDVTAVAADATDIGTVATNLTGTDTIGTVATNIANVNSVGGSISNVNTVATNISSVNDFADKYRIGASDPTVDNDEGDLFYNTTTDTLKVYTGAAWEQGVTAGSGFLPTTGGTMTGDINFGDNDKAVFGAGSDLQIYHDSANANSYIQDAGTGQLRLEADSVAITNTGHTEYVALFNENADVKLYYDGSEKLATSATGAVITGVLTADGLTISTDGYRQLLLTYPDAFTSKLQIGFSNFYVQGSVTTDELTIANNSSGQTKFINQSKTSLLIDNSNDVALYDSTGTTQGFYWDASTQRLGLGTTSPSSYGRLAVMTPTANYGFFGVDNSVGGGGGINLAAYYGTTKISYIDTTLEDGTPASEDTRITFATINNGTLAEKVRITSDGSVGIGTASPSDKLHVEGDIRVNNAIESPNNLNLEAENGALRFYTGSGSPSERARLDSSGNFLHGKTSANYRSDGVELNSNNKLYLSNTSDSCSNMNREGTDGTVLAFSKAGATVGIISITTSGTTYNTTSDLRLKENIEPLVATDKLMAMNPVSYNWKADPDGPRSMGFIAQEMQEVMPEAVAAGDDEDAMMSMDYGRITPILVSALQDAHRKIEQLEQRIADMEAK